jgi:hypothetical protein
LARQTAWLNRTKNCTLRGMPLNVDAVEVLEEQVGKHLQFCFTYRGASVRWHVTNTAWHNVLEKAGLTDVRFHDRRHTWASWHRQAGTSCDELKDLGRMEVAQHGGPVREVCDREPNGRGGKDRTEQAGRQRDTAVTFMSRPEMTKGCVRTQPFDYLAPRSGLEPGTCGLTERGSSKLMGAKLKNRNGFSDASR